MTRIKDKYKLDTVFHSDYRLGVMADFSGNGNNASPTGTPYFMESKNGRCIKFDGATDYLKVPYNASLFCQDVMTVSFWFKSDKTNYTDAGYLVSMWDTVGVNEMWAFVINHLSDQYNISSRSGGGGGYTTDDTNIDVDLDWHHFVLAIDNAGRIWKTYVDGVLEDTSSGFMQTYGDRGSFLTIGGLDGSHYVDGKFREIQIMNVLLTPSEVKQFYTESKLEEHYNKIDIKKLSNDHGAYDATGADTLDVFIADGKGWNESVANVTTNFLENTGWKIDSGTWEVDNSPQKNSSSQLFPNGDMEFPAEDVDSYWGNGNMPIKTIETTTPHSGSQCLRIAYNTTSNPFTFRDDGGGGLTIGKQYRLKGWARADGTSAAYPRIQLQGIPIWTGIATNDWQYFDITFTPTTTDAVWFYTRVSAAGYCEWDDITMSEIKPDGRKEIVCYASGTTYRPMIQAYGTWEFEVRKSLTANVLDVMFIADTIGGGDAAGQDGYGIRFDDDETISLISVTAGTPTDRISTGVESLRTRYQIKVTRTPAGLFTLYVNGTLIGTETHTTVKSSVFSVIDADIGDSVRNFRFLPYIE